LPIRSFHLSARFVSISNQHFAIRNSLVLPLSLD